MTSIKGTSCEKRIDECKLYEGTPMACQNNATCVDKSTGFE